MITNKDAGNTLSEQASGDYDHPPLDEETEFSESEADGNNIKMECRGRGKHEVLFCYLICIFL